MKQKQKWQQTSGSCNGVRTVVSESHVTILSFISLFLSIGWKLERTAHLLALCWTVYDARNDVFFSISRALCLFNVHIDHLALLFSWVKTFLHLNAALPMLCCMCQLMYIYVPLSDAVFSQHFPLFLSQFPFVWYITLSVEFDVMGKSFVGWNFSSTETINRLGSFVKFFSTALFYQHLSVKFVEISWEKCQKISDLWLIYGKYAWFCERFVS